MAIAIGKKTGGIIHPSLAFQLKCEREFDKLRTKIQAQLKNDMLRLYEEKPFADVTFLTQDNREVFCHSSLLKTRAPKFYNYCFSSKSDCICLNNTPTLLPGISEHHLNKFLRTIYYNENTDEAEDSILNELSKSSGCAMENEDLLANEGEPAKKEEDEEQEMENEVDLTETSEVHNMNGTLTDLTDPFSTTSASDLLNVSTLNTNEVDNVSMISAEDLNSMEIAENGFLGYPTATEQQPFDKDFDDDVTVEDEPQPITVPDIIAEDLSNKNPKGDLVVMQDYAEQSIDVLDVIAEDVCDKSSKVNLVVMQNDAERGFDVPDIIAEDFNNRNADAELVMMQDEAEQSIDTAEQPNIEIVEVFEVASALEEVVALDTSYPVEKIVSIEEQPQGVKKAFDETFTLPKDGNKEPINVQLMVVSHESKEGDSGVCSFSRKLSTSSSIGEQGQMADSPTESIPKDDSLEFCPDSLASEVNPSPSVAAVTDLGWKIQEAFQQQQQLTPKLTTWKNTTLHKQTWQDSEESGSPKSSNKPAAIVQPYNADDDADHNKQMAPMMPSPLQATGLPNANDSGNEFQRQAVHLDFVPFLEERIVSDVSVSEREDSLYQSNEMESLPIVSGFRPPEILNVTDVPEVRLSKSGLPERIPILSGFACVETENSVSAEVQEKTDKVEKKREGFFMFIDVSSDAAKQKPEEVKTVEKPAEESVEGERPKEEGFYFIPALVDPLVSRHTKVNEERPVACTPPPPVYMFIDASDNSVSDSPVHHKAVEPPVIRRRNFGSAAPFNRRPKSESAATLLLSETNGTGKSRGEKRISLAFGENEDATCSLDSHDKSPTGEGKKQSTSRLGGDLLRMFLDEINPDVIVSVNGRNIKAHKSVLTSRCAYFAAMLSGGWVESAGNVIKLRGFSYQAVHFALCHIYSGASAVPDDIDVTELASLADMLGLEGLKEVVSLALKMKYCHFFHKPCSTCTTSVAECLLIATSFGLDELQEKCLKWISKHMIKTWPTKDFAALPDEIHKKCLVAAKTEVTVDTVLDYLMRCDKLISTLPHVKWTEPVFSLASRLAEDCSSFLSENFANVLTSNSFLALRSGQSWNIHALETTFLSAVEKLPLDGACQAYVRLHALLHIPGQWPLNTQCDDVNENFEALLSKIHRQVEHFLIHNANRVVRCNSWSLLSADLQKRIKDAAVIVFEFGKPCAPPPRLSSLNRKFTRTRASNSTSSASPTIERVRITSTSSSCSARTASHKNASSAQKETKDHNSEPSAKAATIPRANLSSSKESIMKQTSGKSPHATSVTSKEMASKGGSKSGSRTLPLTKTGNDTKKPLESVHHLNTKARSPIAHSRATVKELEEQKRAVSVDPSSISSNRAPRPKSWPAKEKPISIASHKAKEKIPIKEVPSKDGVKQGLSSSTLSLRSSHLASNGTTRASPSTQRPKSAVFHTGSGGSNRLTKQSSGTATSSKTVNLRKTASADLHGKENKDDLRYKGTTTRPRSDDVSSSAVNKKSAHQQQRSCTARVTSRPLSGNQKL